MNFIRSMRSGYTSRYTSEDDDAIGLNKLSSDKELRPAVADLAYSSHILWGLLPFLIL
jgi:hypothetical protein